jgi:TMEM175 potassium channel family protein
MRRFEALSNTIFGVAMTLLAYNIPKSQLTAAAPKWGEIWHAYAPHLLTLLLSFSIAGIFWFSHQRRLAYAPEASRPAVIVNLLFLLSIILLPITTGLYGTYPDGGDIITLYAVHLTLISALNVILWLIAAEPQRDWPMVGGPAFATLVFLAASTVSLVAPHLTKFVWPIAFITPVVASLVERERN